MLTYALMFSADGTLVDGEEYVNLDDARDVAFNVSEECGLEVSICQQFGIASNVIETVLA